MNAMTHIHIPEAGQAWSLILQSGVRVACTVGIPMHLLLGRELGLTQDQLRPIDALILDGMPVDDPEKTIVPDGARLALAAGLPGIAGLAMKKGSAVRGLRSGITHASGGEAAPRSGTIRLSLYSLVLPLLAGHFLRRGVIVQAAQLLRYVRLVPHGPCLRGDTSQDAPGTPMTTTDLARILAHEPEDVPVLLTADLMLDKA